MGIRKLPPMLALLLLAAPVASAVDPTIAFNGASASTHLAGVVVVQGLNHLYMTAPTGAALAISVLDPSAGAPVSILCYDNYVTGPSCTIDVYVLNALDLTCGPLVATAQNTEAGVSIVTAIIPPSALEGGPVHQFCAFPGISHYTADGGAAIVTVVRA